MAIKIVTYFRVLITLAKEEAEAKKKYGVDSEEYKLAKAEHQTYKELCLRADSMIIE